MLRSYDQTTRLAGKVNTTIQQKPLDQLAHPKGKVTGTNVHHNSIDDHCPFLREAKILPKITTTPCRNVPRTAFRINTNSSGVV